MSCQVYNWFLPACFALEVWPERLAVIVADFVVVVMGLGKFVADSGPQLLPGVSGPEL